MPRLASFRPDCFARARQLMSPARPLWSRGGRGAGALCLTLGVVLALGVARADEFSPVPAGDPIYRQLRALAPGESGDASLTRYEAALQTARVITRVTNDPRADLSRAGWRAVRELTSSLPTELRQLGIDIEATRALADRNLQPVKAATNGVGFGSTAPGGGRETASGRGPIASGALARAGVSGNGSLGANPLGLGELSGSATLRPDVQVGEMGASIMPRLRVGAALLALQRAQSDPFNSSGAGQALLSATGDRFSSGEQALGGDQVLGSDAALNYDVNSWLSVRAQTSRRSLLEAPGATPLGATPLLGGDFFGGATGARGAGGGFSVALGLLKFRTDIESISTNTGARGTSVGGGIGLSAWQNRLSLSAHLARLQPEDRAALEETRTELNIGLGISNRLNLSLLYQGLFTQRNDGTERVVGGLNLSF